MFDKDGKEALEKINKLKNDLFDIGLMMNDGKARHQLEEALKPHPENKRISELEAKLNGLMELLGVTEEKPEETEHKLVKGKKSVSLGREIKAKQSAIDDIEKRFVGSGLQGQSYIVPVL